MKIYTGNFPNMEKIIADDKVVVAICIKCPPEYKGFWIPDLAPTLDMLHEYHQTFDAVAYTEKYQDILAKLDAKAIYHKLCEYGGKKDVVMLCYEPMGEFCHRHLVGQWLHEELGLDIKEWEENQ